MSIDITSLEKAIAQLDEALAYAGSDLAAADAQLALHLRAAAIQAFEFTYELSVRMLRRYLLANEASPAVVDELDFNGLIRLGYARGLLNEELAAWRLFRQDRGTTSHAYDERKARAVFDHIPGFLAEARFLSHQLRDRQAKQP